MTKQTFLTTIMFVLVAASVRGQDIQYQGETSKGGRIQFVLTTQAGQQCVAQLQGSYTIECPLGQAQTFGYSIGTCLPLEKDGSFAFHFPIFPLAQFTFDILGEIAPDGSADGSLAGLYAALTFLDDPECQRCQLDETWMANPVASSNFAPSMNADDFGAFLWIGKNGKGRIQLNNLRK